MDIQSSFPAKLVQIEQQSAQASDGNSSPFPAIIHNSIQSSPLKSPKKRAYCSIRHAEEMSPRKPCGVNKKMRFNSQKIAAPKLKEYDTPDLIAGDLKNEETPDKLRARRHLTGEYQDIPSLSIESGLSPMQALEHHTKAEFVSIFQVAALYHKKNLLPEGMNFKDTRARLQYGKGNNPLKLDAAHDNPFPGLNDNFKETITDMINRRSISQLALKILKVKNFDAEILDQLAQIETLTNNEYKNLLLNLKLEFKAKWQRNSLLHNTKIERSLTATTTCIDQICNRVVDKALATTLTDPLMNMLKECSKEDSKVTPDDVANAYIDLSRETLETLIDTLGEKKQKLINLQALHRDFAAYLVSIIENPSLLESPCEETISKAPSILRAVIQIQATIKELGSQENPQGKKKNLSRSLQELNRFYARFTSKNMDLEILNQPDLAFNWLAPFLESRLRVKNGASNCQKLIAQKIADTDRAHAHALVKLKASTSHPNWQLYRQDYENGRPIVWTEKMWQNHTWGMLQAP